MLKDWAIKNEEVNTQAIIRDADMKVWDFGHKQQKLVQ